MKKDIHPEFYTDCKVTCACGNSFITGSTMKEIRVELCNKCHPFYTGKQKFVDSARRVEKFQEKINKQAAMAEASKRKKTAKKAKTKKTAESKKPAKTTKKTTAKKATKKA